MTHEGWQPRRGAAGVFGGAERIRLVSMLLTLVILGFFIFRESRKAPKQDDQARVPAVAGWTETIVNAPSDLDEAERMRFQNESEALTDRATNHSIEMPAYWRLMQWSRAQSMKDLQSRARRDVLFTQLWETPAEFRGDLIELKVQIRRSLSHAAPENSAGLKNVYEVWGTTVDSQSFPYVLVTAELPPGFPLGGDIDEDVVFAGYFLKILQYEAHDKRRGAPLLIGRVHWSQRNQVPRAPTSSSWGWVTTAVVLLGVALCARLGWQLLRPRPRRVAVSHEGVRAQDDAEEWLRDSTADVADDDRRRE